MVLLRKARSIINCDSYCCFLFFFEAHPISEYCGLPWYIFLSLVKVFSKPWFLFHDFLGDISVLATFSIFSLCTASLRHFKTTCSTFSKTISHVEQFSESSCPSERYAWHLRCPLRSCLRSCLTFLWYGIIHFAISDLLPWHSFEGLFHLFYHSKIDKVFPVDKYGIRRLHTLRGKGIEPRLSR